MGNGQLSRKVPYLRYTENRCKVVLFRIYIVGLREAILLFERGLQWRNISGFHLHFPLGQGGGRVLNIKIGHNVSKR